MILEPELRPHPERGAQSSKCKHRARSVNQQVTGSVLFQHKCIPRKMWDVLVPGNVFRCLSDIRVCCRSSGAPSPAGAQTPVRAPRFSASLPNVGTRLAFANSWAVLPSSAQTPGGCKPPLLQSGVGGWGEQIRSWGRRASTHLAVTQSPPHALGQLPELPSPVCPPARLGARAQTVSRVPSVHMEQGAAHGARRLPLAERPSPPTSHRA